MFPGQIAASIQSLQRAMYNCIFSKAIDRSKGQHDNVFLSCIIVKATTVYLVDERMLFM